MDLKDKYTLAQINEKGNIVSVPDIGRKYSGRGRNGKTIDQMGPDPFVGACHVVEHEREVLREDVAQMLEKNCAGWRGRGKVFVDNQPKNEKK